MNEKPKRRYVSDLRRENAEATRLRISRGAAAAAPPADARLNDLLAGTEQQRLVGSRGPAEHLVAIGALRTELSVERAADQIYALTSFELFERFTEVCGWSVPDCQDWLARILAELLLEPVDRGRR